MKKEVIMFLVVALIIASPVVSADNFLTGFSFFEDVGGFFGNVFEDIKNIFSKEEVGLDTTMGDEVPGRDDGENLDDRNPALPYTLTTNIEEGEGIITRNPDNENYEAGTDVILTATPEEDYEFLTWIRDIPIKDQEDKTITITMDGNKEVTVWFDPLVEICDDGIDNDGDGIVDDLDTDCDNDPFLEITEIRTLEDSFFKHAKIPTVDCVYESEEILNKNNVKACINLTIESLEDNKITASCEQINAEPGFIKFVNCETGDTGNKILQCEIKEICNGYPNSQPKPIIIEEFTTCEEGQINEEIFNPFEIRNPSNNERFEPGEKIEIRIRLQQSYLNEYEEGEEIDVTIIASLVNTKTWEETIISRPITEELEYIGGPEIFTLNLTLPNNLEDNYRIYVKAYKDRYEDELCISDSKSIRILEEDDEGISCEIDNDCRRGYVCTDDECTRLSCELPLILSNDGHSCAFSGAGRGENDRRNEGGQEGIDTRDSDNDGLPDYWENNHFGNLYQGPNDDPDGDGISNINEYINNTNPNVPNKKSPVWTIVIIIVILGIISGATYFIIKKIKKPKSFSSNNKVQKYVQQAKAQGMNKKQIKDSLLKAGWKEKDIKKFL